MYKINIYKNDKLIKDLKNIKEDYYGNYSLDNKTNMLTLLNKEEIEKISDASLLSLIIVNTEFFLTSKIKANHQLIKSHFQAIDNYDEKDLEKTIKYYTVFPSLNEYFDSSPKDGFIQIRTTSGNDEVFDYIIKKHDTVSISKYFSSLVCYFFQQTNYTQKLILSKGKINIIDTLLNTKQIGYITFGNMITPVVLYKKYRKYDKLFICGLNLITKTPFSKEILSTKLDSTNFIENIKYTFSEQEIKNLENYIAKK